MAVRRVEVEYRTRGGAALQAEGRGIGEAFERGFNRAEAAAAKAGRNIPLHLKLVDAGAKEARRSVDDLAGRLGPLGSVVKVLGPAGIAAGAGLAAIGAGAVLAIKKTAELEVALSDLRAITGATGKDLEYFRKQSIALGAETRLGATQFAEAVKLIGSAKPELLETSAALVAVTKDAATLAKASRLELPEAAKVLTTTLNQFRLSAEESTRVINVLAAGAQKGAVELPNLVIAIEKAGTEARQAGVPLELLNATLQELGASGLPLEKIGTSVKNILLKLQTGANETNPAIVGLTQALLALREANLSVEESTKLVGLENQTVFSLMLEGAERAARLATETTGTAGAFEQAAAQGDNLADEIKGLNAQWDGLRQTISNTAPVRKFVTDVTDGLRIVRETIQRGGWSAALGDLGEIFSRDRRRGQLAINERLLRGDAYEGADPALRAAKVLETKLLKRRDAEARGVQLLLSGNVSREFSPASAEDLERAATFGDATRRAATLPYTGEGGIAEAAQKAAKANREAQEKETAFLKAQLDERIAAIDKAIKADASLTEQGERDKAALRAEFERETQKERDKSSKADDTRRKKDLADVQRSLAIEAGLYEKLIQSRQNADKAGLSGEALIRAEQKASVEDFAREVTAAQEKLAAQGNRIALDGAALNAEFRTNAEREANAKIAELRQEASDKLLEQQLRDAEKLAEQQQKLLYEPIRNAIEGTQRGLVDLAISTGDSWEQVGERIIGTIKRIAAEWAVARLFQVTLGELGGGTGGGLLNLSGLLGGSSSTTALPSGGGNSTGAILSLGGTVGKAAFQYSGAGNYLSRLLGFGGSAAPSAGLLASGAVSLPATATSLATTIPNASQFGAGLWGGSNLFKTAGGTVVEVLGPAKSFAASEAAAAAAQPAGTTSAAGAGASGLSTAVAGIGAAIALALASKGLIDDRRSYGRATLNADQAAKNRLTGIGATQIAIGTGIGAGVGTAIAPGFGTLIGAGLGAAVGAAVSQAIAAATVRGIGDGFGEAQRLYRRGLNQDALNKQIKDSLSEDLLLTILGGPFNLAATALFGDLVAPDVEKIIGKLFRQALGRTKLNTEGIAASGRTYGTGLGEEGLIATRLIGATQAASGTDDLHRLRNLRGILLGGVERSARRRGEEAEQILAEVFTDAFDSVLARVLRAIRRGPKSLRAGDTAYTVQAFQRATGLTSLVPEVAANFSDSPPGPRAVRESRKAFTEAMSAALQSAAEDQAFARSLSASFQQAFATAAGSALSKSVLGEAFANLYRIQDRDLRQDYRRARRQGNVGEQISIKLEDFNQDIEEFQSLIANPDFPKYLGQLRDAMVELNVSTALVTDGVAGAAAAITAELQPLIDTVKGFRQLGLDVKSRTAFSIAGPGFAGEAARIEELTRASDEAARALVGAGTPFGPALAGTNPEYLVKNLDRIVAGSVADADLPRALELLSNYGQAELAEMEAKLTLQRQIVDAMEQSRDAARGIRDNIEALLGRGNGAAIAARFFDRAQTDYRALVADKFNNPEVIAKSVESLQTAVGAVGNRYQFLTGASEGFGSFADAADVRRRGSRALREQLAERQAEIDKYLPIALRGGAGGDDAISRLQRLLPEAQQLGAQTLSVSAQRRQDARLRDVAISLESATKDQATVAEKQLTALEAIAKSIEGDATTGLAGANAKLDALKTELTDFSDALIGASGILQAQSAAVLEKRHREIASLLGVIATGGAGPENGELLQAVNRVGQEISAITGTRASGGRVQAGGLYIVGERGPETFAPDVPGTVYPNGTRVQRGGGNVINVTFGDSHYHFPAGTTPAQASSLARTHAKAHSAALAEELRAMGVATNSRRVA